MPRANRPFVPFSCPYCSVEVKEGDQHAVTIEKKNIRRETTIIVKCVLIRVFRLPVIEEVQGGASTDEVSG